MSDSAELGRKAAAEEAAAKKLREAAEAAKRAEQAEKEAQRPAPTILGF